MDAKYEWRDETNLGHPSAVMIDITGIENNRSKQTIDVAPVLKIKKIDSLYECFKRWPFRSPIRIPKGYKFVWYEKVFTSYTYAIFIAVEKVS